MGFMKKEGTPDTDLQRTPIRYPQFRKTSFDGGVPLNPKP